MNLTWSQLALLSALTIGAVSLATYSVYFDYRRRHDKGFRRQISKKKKQQKGPVEGEIERDGSSTASMTPSLEDVTVRGMLDKCDLSISELLALSTEQKQQIFYALLMRGETLMGKGQEGVTKAVEYFSKAVSLVPNPGEVISAFERTLPPRIFSLLLDRIQLEIQAKVRDYFITLTPPGELVRFEESTQREETLGRQVKVWHPIANAEIALGDVLWEEEADIIAPTLHYLSAGMIFCDHCLGPIESDGGKRCENCQKSSFCSEKCFQKARDTFHMHFCQVNQATEEAMQELIDLCRTNDSSLALLMLRYVALLLTEELRGNSTAQNGPFSHYDHLRPVFHAPNEQDRREAALLRTIFSQTNKNLVTFLTDEIYTTIKATLSRNLIAIGENPPKEENWTVRRAECRVLERTPIALAFLHTAAHLKHSCDPNVAILLPDKTNLRKARAVAMKRISKGDPLTMSYLPLSGMSTGERQIHLMRVFSFACECRLCRDELDVAE